MQNTKYAQSDTVAEEAATMLGQEARSTPVPGGNAAMSSNTESTQYKNIGQPTCYTAVNTTVDAGEEETQYDGVKREKARRVPSIKRMLTGEIVPITKSRFGIGRKAEEVDYVISHNPAISRKHAEIKARNGKYYVCDLGAKNKTYVNGMVLPAKGERPISNGDIIKFANEDFLVQI